MQIQGVPVCPHAGGVGLCNMVAHLQTWDFISLTGTTNNRVVEWVDHLHQHFVHPPRVENAKLVLNIAIVMPFFIDLFVQVRCSFRCRI